MSSLHFAALFCLVGFIFGVDLGNQAVSTTTESTAAFTTTGIPIFECQRGFSPIGGKCVLVDPFIQANWEEGRYFCHEVNGELAIVDSIQLFEELVDYIISNGLDTRNYWIGGTDSVKEGDWKWVNGEPMQMGTPYWALAYGNLTTYNNQEPVNPKPGDNCLQLDGSRYFYFDDYDCLALKSVICEGNPI